jgi:hypothetical protein
MPIDWRAVIAIFECVALAGSWIWLRTQKLSYPGWRRKASVAALTCASLAVFLNLINTGIIRSLETASIANVLLGPVGRNVLTGLLAATITTACLSLILAIFGKGSPRVLASAWFCVLLFPNMSLLPGVAMGVYKERRDAAPMRYRLALLAGKGATNCGHVRPRTDPKPSSECVLRSFENHMPFYVLYDTQEIRIDSSFMDGLAGDQSGNLYDVEFSSRGWSSEVVSLGVQLFDGGRVLVESCQKPVTLKPSIYKGLTCIPRIMVTAQ